MAQRELIGRTPLRHADGSFTRASAAYLADPREGMASYGNDEKRTRTVLSVNAAVPAFSTMLYSGSPVVPVAHDGTYLVGQVVGANTLVTLAPGGTAWELASTFASGTIQNVWAVADGRLLLTIKVSTTVYVRYSDDHGSNWSNATRGGNPMQFATDDTLTDVWSLLVAGDVLFLMEYAGESVDARYIYRSLDNGATWTICYDRSPAPIHHFHCGGYLPPSGTYPQGRVVVVIGDAGCRQFVYSDDLGETWADLFTLNEIDVQPTSMVPLPDGKMLCGSDRELQAYVMDVDGTEASERTIEPVGVEWDRRNRRCTDGTNWTGALSRTYGLHVRRVAGVYYAGAWESFTPAEPIVISVSPDGRRFLPYLRLPLLVTEVARGLRAGPFLHDGQLHLNVTYQTSSRHVICELARIAETPAVLIEPALAAADNLLDAADGACSAIDNAGTDRYWQDYGPPWLTLDESQGFQGDSCVRETDARPNWWTHSNYKRINNYSPSRFVAGDLLAIRFWCTGWVAMLQGSWAHFPSGALTNVVNTYEELWSSWHTPAPASFWQSLIPTPIIAPAVDANNDWKFVVYKLSFYAPGYYAGVSGDRTLRDHDLRFDALLATKNMPAVLEWHPGGTARAEDVLSHDVEVDTNWTHVFRVILRNAPWDLRGYGESGAGKIATLYVQSWWAAWSAGEGTKIELYYDVQSCTFKLQRNTDGSTATITTEAVVFSRETPAVFVVQRYRGSATSARFRFAVLLGGLWYESTADMTEAATAAPLTGSLHVRTGGLDGQMAMPMWRTDDSWVYDGVLSKEQIEARLVPPLVAASDRGGGLRSDL